MVFSVICNQLVDDLVRGAGKTKLGHPKLHPLMLFETPKFQGFIKNIFFLTNFPRVFSCINFSRQKIFCSMFKQNVSKKRGLLAKIEADLGDFWGNLRGNLDNRGIIAWALHSTPP